MTTSQTFSDRQFAPIVSFTFKVVGVIFALVTVVDLLIASIPFNLVDRQWQIAVITLIIERGTLPLLGLLFLFTGYWLDSAIHPDGGDRRKLWHDLRFWMLVISTLIGVFILVLIPLHLTNLRASHTEVINQINETTKQEEAQLEPRLQEASIQQRTRVEMLLADPGQLDQMIKSGQVSPEDGAQLQKLQKNPQSVDPFLQEQDALLRQQAQQTIKTRREAAIQQANLGSLKSAIRIGINGILLTIAYTAIGWFGLRNLGAFPLK